MPDLGLRLLGPADWMLYRTLRLAALSDAPLAFGSTVASAEHRSETQWRDRLAHHLVLVAESDGEAVGLVGLLTADHGDDVPPGHGEIVSMWVRPKVRGTGVGHRLLSAVLRRAADRRLTTVDLWVSAGNLPAERFYARHGFVRTGAAQPLREGSAEQVLAMATAVPPGDVRPVTVRRVVPVVTVADIAAVRDTYTGVLGLTAVMDHGWIATFADPTGRHQLSLLTRDPTAPVNPSVSVEVDDVDAAHQAAVERGEDIVHPLQDEDWGVRRFFFRDAAGHVVNVLAHR